MSKQQAQNRDESAEQAANSARQAFQMLADRIVALQESNLMLTKNFFQRWLEQIQSQTQGAREATWNLQEQSQRQQEAFDRLSQEAMNQYSEFLNSALSFYQESLETAAQVAKGDLEHRDHESSGPTDEEFTMVSGRRIEKPWPRYPLFASGDPTFAKRVDEELAGFGER